MGAMLKTVGWSVHVDTSHPAHFCCITRIFMASRSERALRCALDTTPLRTAFGSSAKVMFCIAARCTLHPTTLHSSYTNAPAVILRADKHALGTL